MIIVKMLSIFLTIAFVYVKNSSEQHVYIEIKQGALEGGTRKTWGGRTIYSFQGIPYAEPPVGKKRFQPPMPAKPWNGTLSATKSHAFCPQRDIFHDDSVVFGDENCLFLNVYTPNITIEEELLPVVVFIHGGGFTSDSANPELYGPDILLDHDLVLVTINYRLGALGFLSLEDNILPGNNGLKDQTLALQWVRDNIDRFGGNPNKVTIFGNSAGGASVYYHILSPSSKGLFHSAISSSGVATSTWALAKPGEGIANAIKLAKSLKCPTSPSTEILKCLQKVDAYDTVKHVDKLMEFSYEDGIPYRPVIEPKIPGAFITDHPIDVIKFNNFSQVPYVMGIMENDGAMKSAAIYTNYTLVEKLNREFNDIIALMFFYNDHKLKQKISAAIRKFYFQNKTIDNSAKSELTDMFTDGFFYYPQRATSEIHAKYSSQPVYFYLFGYKGTLRTSTYFGDDSFDYGVSHCDDLNYILNHQYMCDYKPTESDLRMTTLMTTLLYNFAKTGNPTPGVTSLVKWKPLGKNNFNFYNILGPNNVKMESELFEERYNFWKKLNVFSHLVDDHDIENQFE